MIKINKLFALISIIIGAMLLLCSFFFNIEKKAIAENTINREEAKFDENNISLTFANLSDVHIGYGNNDNIFRNALNIIDQRTKGKIDALFFSGDNTQDGTSDEAKKFVSIINEFYDTKEVASIMTNGNHDTYWSGCMSTAQFVDAFGQDVFTFDVDKSSMYKGNRHAVVNGFHFITIQIETFMPNINNLSAETKFWLDTTLSNITKENPLKPVFLSCHSPQINTVAGSFESDDTGIWGASKDLAPILNKYPQAIFFSGHTHYNINTELAIMQDQFTNIASGCVCDLDMNRDYIETQGGLANARTYSQGMIVEVDNQGNVRVTRVDFVNNKQIKDKWIIPSPKADKSHLQYYTKSRGTIENEAPKFSENAKIDVKYKTADKIEITYDIASDNDMVEYYLIEILNSNNSVVNSMKSLAPFYMYPDLTQIPFKRTLTVSDFKLSMPFKVQITAYDSWNLASEKIFVTVKDTSEEDQKIADEIIEKINQIGTVTKDSLTFIQQIRSQYNTLSYQQKLKVSNYKKLTDSESILYNVYYVTDDVNEHEITTDIMYSTCPTTQKGSFEGSIFNGVTLKWNSATKNNSLGISKTYKLDRLHISLSNLSIQSNDKTIGFVISSIEKDKYISGECLLIYIDFNTGNFYVGDGSSNKFILQTDYFIYDNLLTTPFDVEFSLIEESYTIKVSTIYGSKIGEIPKSCIDEAMNLNDKNDVYLSFTPWTNNFSGNMDVISVCNSEVPKDDLPEKHKGCSSNINYQYFLISPILFLVSINFYKRKNIYNIINNKGEL